MMMREEKRTGARAYKEMIKNEEKEANSIN